MKWACLLAVAFALSINYEQAEATQTIEVYFVFDDAALKKFLGWGARSMNDAKRMAATELDYMITELKVHYKGLGLNVGRRDVKYLSKDVFRARNGQIQEEEANNAFRAYLKKDNAKTRLDYDMAILFTGYDLGTPSNNRTSGYADIGAVCRTEYGTGVVEFGGHYGSITILAHEMGHILGATHDGAGDGHIMSPGSVWDSPHRWSFSSRSRSQINGKIRELDRARNNCLKRTNSRTDTTINVGLPDSISTPDKICQRKWGPDSFMCRFRERTGDDLCYAFMCDTKDPGGMCWSAVTSDGMACGKGKACRKGRCVRDSKISNSIDDTCPFGDMKKVSIGSRRYMECGELISSGKGRCSSAMDKAKCCKTCGDLNTGDPNCPYGDAKQINFNRRMQTCGAVISQFTGICSRNAFMREQCCASCKSGGSNSGGSCKDNHGNCASWAAGGECRANPKWMLPNCKKSCGYCFK